MTARELFEAVGMVDDDLIMAADTPAARRKPMMVNFRGVLCAAACVCAVLLGVRVLNQNSANVLVAGGTERAAEAAAPDEANYAAPSTESSDAGDGAMHIEKLDPSAIVSDSAINLPWIGAIEGAVQGFALEEGNDSVILDPGTAVDLGVWGETADFTLVSTDGSVPEVEIGLLDETDTANCIVRGEESEFYS
ncbi:MAG: hypothetical protein ACI4KN_04410, partial [Gemmiger sp.]